MDDFGNPQTIFDYAIYWAYSGFISGTLIKQNSPYIIVGGLYVDEELIIDPGVILKFFPDAWIEIQYPYLNSTLKALGTKEEPVIFTSFNNNPQPGDWDGIWIRFGDIELKYTIIEYAKTVLQTVTGGGAFDVDIAYSIFRFNNNCINSFSGHPAYGTNIRCCLFTDNTGVAIAAGITQSFTNLLIIKNSIISNNGGHGVSLNKFGYLVLDHCTISNNSGYGVYITDVVYQTNDLILNYCNIFDNNVYDVYNNRRGSITNPDINAKYNYWGEYTTNQINQGSNPKNLDRIFDVYDNTTKGFVNYGAWLQDTIAMSPAPVLISPPNNSINSNHNITCSWSDPSNSAFYYHFQLSDDAYFNTLIYDITALYNTSYMVANLPEVTTLYWRVSLTNIFGESKFSEPWNFSTALYKPTNLSGMLFEPWKIHLTWEDNSENEILYIVERKYPQVSWEIIDTLPFNTTSFIDSLITDSTEYTYRVKCENDTLQSEYSNTITVSTLVEILRPDSLQASLISYRLVELDWNDNSNNEIGFIIERKLTNQPIFEIIDTVVANAISFTDSTVLDSSSYEYRITAYNEYGYSPYSNIASVSTILVDVNSKHMDLPNSFYLYQNYPNPFNPISFISYDIPVQSFVTLRVYDVLGNEILTLVNGEKAMGSYEVEFGATNLPSGIYFYRIQAGSFVDIKKMVLLK